MTQNSSLQPPPQSLSSENYCVNCNSDDHWILHNVGNRVEQRKLCTSCVLKCHPTSFCPTCFNLHDPNSLSPPPFSSSSTPSSSSSSSSNRTLTCLKCSSVSHITCVPPNAPKSPYLCPPCSNPSFKFFDVKKKSRKIRDQNGQPDGGNGGSRLRKVQEGEEGQGHVMEVREARMLVLAARISVISMNKVLAAVKSDAERRVRDAALARKRAKESIDHVVTLSSKLVSVKQQQRREAGPGSVYEPIKIERNGVAHNVGGSSSVGNGNRAVVAVPQSNGGNATKNHVGMKENTGL